MFGEIKQAIKENKKLFMGFGLILASLLIILLIQITDRFILSDSDASYQSRTSSSHSSSSSVGGSTSLSKPNFGVSDSDSIDYFTIILLILFVGGLSLILSSEKKK